MLYRELAISVNYQNGIIEVNYIKKRAERTILRASTHFFLAVFGKLRGCITTPDFLSYLIPSSWKATIPTMQTMLPTTFSGFVLSFLTSPIKNRATIIIG